MASKVEQYFSRKGLIFRGSLLPEAVSPIKISGENQPFPREVLTKACKLIEFIKKSNKVKNYPISNN